jgi:glycosyltransferase involved in cell wall biosynthesis
MRIGIDCRLPTYQMGGISQSILQLIPALADLHSENDFVLFQSRKENRSFLPESAENFSRQNLWTPCHHRFERWSIAAELFGNRLDAFHSPDFIPPAGGAKRYIITIHDLNFIYFPELLTAESKRYYLDQIEWAVDTADHIAADSHATRRDVIELLNVPQEKISTVYLAANPIYKRQVPEAVVEKTLKRYDLSSGFVLFVGTLEPRKNLPMVIQAYAQLRQKWHVDVPLILIGNKGWMFEDIFATIEALNLQDYVRHLTGIVDEELAHFYHAAGALVTPSFYEGFGLPALEAQHCGCPVIVSNRGSLPEIVGDGGITLDPEDIHGWVDTLALVLNDDDLRKKMIQAGKVQANKFSWQKTAKKMLSIYTGKS